jgi:hypothetical protein
MQQLGNHKATSRKASSIVGIAAALLGAVVLCQPDPTRTEGTEAEGMAVSTAAVSTADFTVMSLPCTTSADFTGVSLPCTAISLMSTRVSRSEL